MSIYFSASECFKATIRMVVKSFELKKIRLLSALKVARVVVVMVVRNEAERLPFFIKYYRKLGCDHFIIIDNASSDATMKYILAQPDVSIYRTNGSYAASRFGNDWINYVLNKNCIGKWILYVDADELIVYPHDDKKNIIDLVDYLDKRGDSSMNCIMVDMYSSLDIKKNVVPVGENPLHVCNLFDRYGYYFKYEGFCNTTWVKGGVRGRMFFNNNLWQGPALNKTSLVKWKIGCSFLKSAHQLWPLALNAGCRVGEGEISGALLHFKFVSTIHQLISEENNRRQHTLEYANYAGLSEDNEISFVSDNTEKYENWKSLYNNKLLNGADWAGNDSNVES